MKDIGEELKRTREEQGLSLKDAQVATKIRQKYLEALEEGDDSVMPGEVYCKGFLRSYADFLGLDGWAMVKRYREWKDTVRPPEQVAKMVQPARAPRPRPRYLAGFVIFLLLVFGGFLGRQYILAIRPPEPPAFTPPPLEDPLLPGDDQDEREDPEEPDAPSAPEVVREAISDTMVVYTIDVDTLRLEIGVAPITDRCWVEITVDGQVVFEGMLLANETQVWEASEEIMVRAGRPWSLTYDLNGNSWGPEGRSDAPAMVIFFRKG